VAKCKFDPYLPDSTQWLNGSIARNYSNENAVNSSRALVERVCIVVRRNCSLSTAISGLPGLSISLGRLGPMPTFGGNVPSGAGSRAF